MEAFSQGSAGYRALKLTRERAYVCVCVFFLGRGEMGFCGDDGVVVVPDW